MLELGNFSLVGGTALSLLYGIVCRLTLIYFAINHLKTFKLLRRKKINFKMNLLWGKSSYALVFLIIPPFYSFSIKAGTLSEMK